VTVLQLLAIGSGVAVTLFTLTWVFATKVRNYGFLDVVWSLSVGILAAVYGWLGSGDATRRVLFSTAALIWSLRLGLYILIRVVRHHPEEDKRYQTLRQRWPGPLRFLLFFELQALIAVIFSLPFLLAAVDSSTPINTWEWLGIGAALVCTVGEAVADLQAQRWKRNPTNRNKVINTGLWRYSRHPNYFFESLVWCFFCIAALPIPYGWITILCPVLMLYFLLAVTGIPLSEKHSVESRGDAYREYQRTTSRFIPWFPKR
jgi:steroid 5-alpha reductase family enzyme